MLSLNRIFRGNRSGPDVGPLYAAIVAAARQPGWYREGAVADTLDGRFDMVTAVLSLVLLRLEEEGDSARAASALVTERFVSDMDGQIRELGIGDVVVGKHIGRMMGALGGRLGAYRAGLAPDGDLSAALARNVYRGEPVAAEALASTTARIRALAAALAATPGPQLIAGAMPQP